jgi:hypothetical protein
VRSRRSITRVAHTSVCQDKPGVILQTERSLTCSRPFNPAADGAIERERE